MKKFKILIFLILTSLSVFSQTPTGQEAEFDYGIKNNSAPTVSNPDFLVTQGVSGVYGKTSGTVLETKTENSAGAMQGLKLLTMVMVQ